MTKLPENYIHVIIHSPTPTEGEFISFVNTKGKQVAAFVPHIPISTSKMHAICLAIHKVLVDE